MFHANLIVLDKEYSNDDAIPNMIQYIYRLHPAHFWGYGFWPQTEEAAILTFENLRKFFPDNTCEQKVQHLVLSFTDLDCKETALLISNEVAAIFQFYHPICFALHDDTKNLHTHFAISTTSHIPGHPPLVGKNLRAFLNAIHQFAESNQILLTEVRK